MRYIVFFNHVEGVWDRLDEAERARHAKELEALVEALAREKNSKLVFFHPPAEARTVRIHEDGRRETSAGPARPGREQTGGYYLIDADSMEEAVAWAERGRFLIGSNEVREIYA